METIQTYHPQKRKGVVMKKDEYELLREFILKELKENSEVSFQDLVEKASVNFRDLFVVNGPWTLLMVKLDLEARGVIKSKKLLGHGRYPVIYLKRGGLKMLSEFNVADQLSNVA